MDLNGKIAVVTGGARGIGRAISYALVKQGAKVIIVDYNINEAHYTAEEIKKEGYLCTVVKADISKAEEVKKAIESVLEENKSIDILVNNAGITQNIEIEDLEEDDWDKVMDTNLKGAFFFSKYVFLEMKKNKSGKIINIASLAGERGGNFAGINYSSSKAGIIVMTKCFALKGGQYNINVNAVAPGLIKTKMAEQLKFNTNEIPLNRLGTPEEIAEVVVFLSSSKASYITGATIDVNGGIYMR